MRTCCLDALLSGFCVCVCVSEIIQDGGGCCYWGGGFVCVGQEAYSKTRLCIVSVCLNLL